MRNEIGKICSAPFCELQGQLQSLDNFHKNNKSRDRRINYCKPCEQIRVSKWCRKNKAHRLAWNAKNRSDKLCRTPIWADQEIIEGIYEASVAMTEKTGIPHAVDHIDPLKGKLVSGLHVENNLQILTGSKNSSKNNKFTPYRITKPIIKNKR